MNPIQSFHSKLRGLAAVLDGETARLTRALDGEDSGEGAGGRAGGCGCQWAAAPARVGEGELCFAGVAQADCACQASWGCWALANSIHLRLFGNALSAVLLCVR